jgi:hypothetical protein
VSVVHPKGGLVVRSNTGDTSFRMNIETSSPVEPPAALLEATHRVLFLGPRRSGIRRSASPHVVLLACVFLFSVATRSIADDVEEIAKQAQNPVASLISVPFQNNLNFGVGPKDDQQNVLDIQPVIPIKLTDDWNLITRTIVPVVYEPYISPTAGDATGLGDVQLAMYLSPTKSTGSIIWGVGPAISFPTATERYLGQGKFSAGLSAAVLTIRGPWLFGFLTTDITSVGGESDRENVHQFLLQPFVNFNFAHGWYLASSPIITANWKIAEEDRWTVPVGGGGGKIFRVGKQRLNAYVQAFDNVVHPHEAGNWTLRVQLQLLFPK